MSDDAVAEFTLALAAAILGEGDPVARAAEAAGLLPRALDGGRSLVLEVQFTGFSRGGVLVGGVDPLLLRAAGHLITLRVNRLGFTAEAGEGDLAAFVRVAGRSSAELAPGDVLDAVAAAAPAGVYVGSASGRGYRPARPAPVAEVEAAPAPSSVPDAAAAPAASATPTEWEDEVEETELAEFEILDPVDLLSPPDAEAEEEATSGAGPRVPGGGAEMFSLFRTADADETRLESFPELLAGAETVTRFDELAVAATRAALGLLRAGSHPEALSLLEALVAEATRDDRNRFFREAAVQALRRTGSGELLHLLHDYLTVPGGHRERILRISSFVGTEAVAGLEPLLYRRGDGVLAGAVFRALCALQGLPERIISRAMEDPNPLRVRALLELAQGGEDAELARSWAAEASGHPDAGVRVEAVRTAAKVGGRGAMRILVDGVDDAERLVRREAVTGLGTLGDAAAVPFLSRVLSDGSDEELQVAAAHALGALGSAEALPPLLGLLRKRSFLPLRRSSLPRLAAVQALGRVRAPAAREALESLAAGRDDLAAEARRLLQG